MYGEWQYRNKQVVSNIHKQSGTHQISGLASVSLCNQVQRRRNRNTIGVGGGGGWHKSCESADYPHKASACKGQELVGAKAPLPPGSTTLDQVNLQYTHIPRLSCATTKAAQERAWE